MFRKKQKNKKGFTLIEVMVSVSIFTIIATVGMGALLSINRSYRQSQSRRIIYDNLNFVLESMTRMLRTGRAYYCGKGGSLGEVHDCEQGGTTISFVNNEGQQVIFSLNTSSDTIDRTIKGDGPYPITTNGLAVTRLMFYVVGSSPEDNIQPSVYISLEGEITDKGQSSPLALSTMVSQRALDRQPE
jgi:prepilin-type N-terminal cleavage/methylation domain-containing protein